MIELALDPREIATAMPRYIRAFRKVLAQKSIRVLVRSTLPWTASIAEVDRGTSGRGDVQMPRHLAALIPGDRLQ